MCASAPSSNQQPSGQDLEAAVSQIHDILAEAGIHVAVELRDGTVFVSGEVDSDENYQAVLDVANAVAGPLGLQVDDAIDIVPSEPDPAYASIDTADHGAFAYVNPDLDRDAMLDPGFEDEPDFVEDIGTSDPMEAAAEAIPYFPPTDPVVRPSHDEEDLEIVGGFGATAMDEEMGGASFEYRPDEEITSHVLEELKQDALTTDLVINVVTRNGVVYLYGAVPTLEDAENAEAVAARVPGVKEVREELVIESLLRPREP